ncbi:PREDICTED: probable LRR receptor-like serine/threonine-protein kinase At1g06840 isoform X1 [Nicotiana attenuata]|uniref:non-specific serine/threonine protein kinase n=1 Tax=Nicotiana attenuata TaxID=49451 RepID=A0A1J6KC35_NICAT|nr:PREDICTED: probable LRR receptor-like serine/threonine-protein kinase At1g06840 isoform X1 [Nicotiana attenuata]XP_019235163.1 PREDICTED: probable LRR receptor-like serine/threonine-protein kinase At1g06840 isoform X1 [Nicotiana attenuata]OIT26252.1 putative lrr receptor-like serinethreonine-protein kinase [Nicotiana attenuata]
MEGVRYCGYVFTTAIYCFMLLTVAQVTHPSEVSALVSVKSGLIDNMEYLKNWQKGSDPCISNWTEVYCFNKVGTDGYFHVRELRLMNMNLSGSLAPELGQLSHLKIMNFMWNDLTGNVPGEIGKIKSLKLLLLNGNRFSGSLPDQLGYLLNLRIFQIDQNQISGSIPKSFSHLNSMQHIHFNNNSLSGQIPKELSNISTLIHLLLDSNNLSGYLPPEFSAFPSIRIIQLDNNNFSRSEIPASYGNISSLVKLSLRNCKLQGSIPDLSRIQNLSYLDLSWNQLSGSIPQNKLSNNMTTIILSHNRLDGSIPKSFSSLPSLQKLSLENNHLNGSFSTVIWQKKLTSTSRLEIDLRNNSLSDISGTLEPPLNVTLRLQGNPVCSNANVRNIIKFCGSEARAEHETSNSTNVNGSCPIHACPKDNYYEYVPTSPVPCSCASPLRVGWRLKSPSFSYFDPYVHYFLLYMTSDLHLDLYQMLIESSSWEEGPRLRMHLKVFPAVGVSTFNKSEVIRISELFSSWDISVVDLFGPYELLNFTLLGPYSYLNPDIQAKHKSKGALIAAIVAGVFAAFVSTIIAVLIKRQHAKYQSILSSRKRLSSRLSIKMDGIKSFTFREMTLATNNFDISNQVGEGGYGTVFKGILADKTIVAIKRAKEGSLQGQKEFLTEISLLSRLHHRNLVSLLGYCDEEGEQMLVYEFMCNGTLRNWISVTCKESLKFGARLQIALGAAKGILYLHTEAHPPIFHRDIKASNILLDSKMTAKVADFGLSRLAPVQDDEGVLPNHVSTIVKGTPGYLDPEYFLTRKLTDKSDVYSLGVVFLEILTGMRPISHGKNIVREVNLAHDSEKMFSVMDSTMGPYPSECMEKFAALALKCCEDKPEDRPSMLEVVRELETIQSILNMIPDTEAHTVDSKAKFNEPKSSSSFSETTSRDAFLSSSMTGGYSISGITLTMPR